MTDDIKIAIEARCQATSGFGPKSVRPIGRSKLFLDRSEIGSVQVQSPVGPVRLHLKKCRSYALDRTGPRLNRGCASLSPALYTRKLLYRLCGLYLESEAEEPISDAELKNLDANLLKLKTTKLRGLFIKKPTLPRFKHTSFQV